MQLPPTHVSLSVQASPSLQTVPSGAVGLEHWPLDGSQTPATWQASEAAQVTALLPVQLAATHESVCVQASPSLQVVPSGAAGFEHAPLDGSQTPATWQASEAAQVTALLPVQPPATHESVCVQASPSLQGVPSGAVEYEHSPVLGSQTPAS